jgi:small conductance mechanosensitive channel
MKISNLLADTESLIVFGVILVATIIFATLVKRIFLRKLINKNKESSIDLTSIMFIKHIITLTIYLVGVGWGLLALPITKNFAHSLLAGAGATTLIIGFASQQILGNMMSGILIMLNKPFKINDQISIQGNNGKVVEINWHDTIIENENSEIIIIPNSVISSNIIKNIKKK